MSVINSDSELSTNIGWFYISCSFYQMDLYVLGRAKSTEKRDTSSEKVIGNDSLVP